MFNRGLKAPTNNGNAQTSVSKVHQQNGDRLYAIMRRIASRVAHLELENSTLKRDIWRIEKKLSRDTNNPPTFKAKQDALIPGNGTRNNDLFEGA